MEAKVLDYSIKEAYYIFSVFTAQNWRLMKYNLPIIIEKGQDGYSAYAPDLQGCYTQGNTSEEGLANIQ